MMHSSLETMAPILLAASGGLLTELSGTLNIALEGLILVGAFVSAIVAGLTGSLVLGALSAGMVSGILAWGLGAFTFRTKANVFITGLGANLLCANLASFVSKEAFGTQGVLRFENIGTQGGLFGVSWSVWVSLAMVVVTGFLVNRTRTGLRIRSCGANANAVFQAGLDVDGLRTMAMAYSGFLSGLAGAALSLGLGAYVPGSTLGKGWIALVAIYLGYRRPLGILVSCLAFGFANTLAAEAQGSLSLPPSILLAFPYLATLAGLVVFELVVKRFKGKARERR